MARSSPTHPRLARRPRSRCFTVSLLLLLCAASGPAAASPLRAPRPAPGPPATLTTSGAATPLDRACGTDVDALGIAFDAAATRAAQDAAAVLPTPNSTDVGEIAVLEDDGTFFFPDKGGNINLDVAAAARAFYRTHGDDYDQVAFWLTSGLSNWLGSPTALAAAWPTRNANQGIGLSLYDWNAALGLPPRVQSLLTMNGLDRYPADPSVDVPGLPNYVTQDVLAHEFGHEWLAYPMVDIGGSPATVLLGRGYQHWSFFFDSDGSVMEGPDWEAAGPDTFFSHAPIARFGPLDQYLMGVRPGSLVDSFFVISPSAQFWPPGPYVSYSDPNASLRARGPSWRFGIEDVVAANGQRLPAAPPAPPTIRVAFVLIVPRGFSATASDLAKLEGIRAAFPTTVAQYTGGRMLLDASLDSRVGRLRLSHRRLPDTETPGLARPVGLRVNVDPAGIPISVNPSAVTLRWRTDPFASWSVVPMTPVTPDSFTALLPAAPLSTTIQYAFDAESVPAGVVDSLPGHGPPFSTRVGLDDTAPVVTHWAQYAQAAARLPQPLLARVTDNLGLQVVWCEYEVDGGPTHFVVATSAGGDSFVVSLGAGVPQGSKIAYRFVGRDASAGLNLGYSNELFDTLRVGSDHVDGFWNPSPWTHGNVRFNRRDEWHLVERAAAPAGSGAWHCGRDSIPYGPYQDAALTSGLVYGIAPGCTLTFAHRYDLEEGSATAAYDGARVEVQVNGGAFEPATPVDGYSHIMTSSDQGLPLDAPCWSGRQSSWRVERVDLSPFAPGPIRVRFRMSSDLFVGGGGWWVDDVRVRFPNQATAGVPRGTETHVELGPLWPNPSASALRQAVRLSRDADVEWALYDLAGRRVATLWSGALKGGSRELAATPPRTLPGGLYFSRVVVNGAATAARRVALLR